MTWRSAPGEVDNRRPVRRATPVSEPCVCRGPDVVAASVLDGDILDGVRRHQIEPAHIAWCQRSGIPLSPDQLRAKELDALASELVGRR